MIDKAYLDARFDKIEAQISAVQSAVGADREEEVQRLTKLEGEVGWLKSGFWTVVVAVLGWLGVKLS